MKGIIENLLSLATMTGIGIIEKRCETISENIKKLDELYEIGKIDEQKHHELTYIYKNRLKVGQEIIDENISLKSACEDELIKNNLKKNQFDEFIYSVNEFLGKVEEREFYSLLEIEKEDIEKEEPYELE